MTVPTKKSPTKKSPKLAIEATTGLPIFQAIASAVVAGVRLDEISRLYQGQSHQIVCEAK